MRHQSAADASQQLHFDAGTCAGSGLGLQQHTSCSASQMQSTLCTAAVDPVITDHRRCGACGTGRHVAARTEPAKHEDQSTCRDDEDLSAPFASGVMPTSASYVIMAIIRHTRRVHGNSECTVRQVHGATHCHEGHAASHRLGFGLLHRVLACWCSVARCSPRYGRHLHGSGSITTHMEHDNMCEPIALKTTRKSTKRA